MSHFCVLVMVPKKKIKTESREEFQKVLKKIMSPYQENNMGDCPPKYMKFNDVTEECEKEWENDSSTMVKMEDGSFANTHDERFRVEGIGIGTHTHKTPKHLKEVKIPHKVRYENFEEFVKDWSGYKKDKKDKKTGRYGYWENPNAKWDWWTIGGRWTGSISGFDAYNAPENQERCDGCFGTGIRPGGREEFGEEWFKGTNGCNGCKGTGKRAKWTLNDHDGDIQLVENVKKDFVPFAIIDADGKWYEKGEMGWFGVSSGDKKEKVWDDQAKKLIIKNHEKSYAVIVDCHI